MDKKDNLILEFDSNVDETFSINQEYLNKYKTWRRKEEIQKLEAKYGNLKNCTDNSDSSSSSDESEDELAEEISESVEKSFFKALSALKSRDPKIYRSETAFFGDDQSSTKMTQMKSSKKSSGSKNKESALRINDYERICLLEEIEKEHECEVPADKSLTDSGPTYVETQRNLIQSFANIPVSDEEEDTLLMEKVKTATEEDQEESSFAEWLQGKSNNYSSPDKEDLAFLQKYWNNPQVDEGELFLRDYLLNRRYREKDDGDAVVDNVDYEEDEILLEKQSEFERKHNFRFEEPNAHTIITYPRDVKDSLRRKDDSRKQIRERQKERKEREKLKREEEVKLLKNLKKKEISEKLEKIKETAKLESISLNDHDLDGDYDPDEHDRKMKETFNDEYYSRDDADQKRPQFSDSDDDEQFDNDEPTTSSANTYRSINKKLKEEVLAQNSEIDVEKYFDEYYKLDYEDVIGDIPCRFKYRNVMANDFGLSADEVFNNEDKTLNAWVSLKKMTQYTTEEEEKYLLHSYQRKAKNVKLKYRIFNINQRKENNEKGRKQTNDNASASKLQKASRAFIQFPKDKKQLKRTVSLVEGMSDGRMEAYGVNPKKLKNVIKYGNILNEKDKTEKLTIGEVKSSIWR
ncbi:Protein KRI1 -like protein [Trichinella zimbabwensis]|uniref:Protein KRI1 homolog n=1 Tax=Trichinella zimbabwensis TaxID=268475 RepID=A0A0V1HX06_9BILA|nr:Protein KRI1 -like protein [Trichinella zimbabwensis]